MNQKKEMPEHFHHICKGKKEQLLKLSEIGLWIDSYDDIFSDFDPRQYSERALSDDFLIEAKRASKDKASGQIALKFLAKESIRNPTQETLIKKRLKDHFRKHHSRLRQEKTNIIKKGVCFAISGIIVMLIATFIATTFEERNTLITFLIILLEPAGWFLFWEGLNQIIFEPKNINPDFEFYEKMAKSEITFISY